MIEITKLLETQDKIKALEIEAQEYQAAIIDRWADELKKRNEFPRRTYFKVERYDPSDLPYYARRTDEPSIRIEYYDQRDEERYDGVTVSIERFSTGTLTPADFISDEDNRRKEDRKSELKKKKELYEELRKEFGGKN
jgi:hypothetical protein